MGHWFMQAHSCCWTHAFRHERLLLCSARLDCQHEQPSLPALAVLGRQPLWTHRTAVQARASKPEGRAHTGSSGLSSFFFSSADSSGSLGGQGEEAGRGDSMRLAQGRCVIQQLTAQAAPTRQAQACAAQQCSRPAEWQGSTLT